MNYKREREIEKKKTKKEREIKIYALSMEKHAKRSHQRFKER